MNPETIIQRAISEHFGARTDVVVNENPTGRAHHYDRDTGKLVRVVAYGCGGDGTTDLQLDVELMPGSAVWLSVWMEVKTATGRLRPDQVTWHAAAQRRRRFSCIVRSVAEAEAAVRDVRATALSRLRSFDSATTLVDTGTLQTARPPRVSPLKGR